MLFDLDRAAICRGSFIFRSEVEQIPAEYFPVLTLWFFRVKTKERKIKIYSLCRSSNDNSGIIISRILGLSVLLQGAKKQNPAILAFLWNSTNQVGFSYLSNLKTS